MESWRRAQVIRSGSVTPSNSDPHGPTLIAWQQWVKPAPRRYKCNIDASFSSSLNKVRLGMCLRDEEGNFMVAKTTWFSSLCIVNAGEAMSFYTALYWVANLHFDNVDFVLDSKKVVDSFRTCINDATEFGCIIYACKQLFQNKFQNSHVKFSRRQANGVAHEPSKIAHVMVAPTSTMMYYHVSGP